MQKEKVLVTGASGLIGYPLLKELAKSENYEIFAVTTGRKKIYIPEYVKTITADLKEDGICEELVSCVKPTKLIHLAWALSSADFMNSDENLTFEKLSIDILKSFLKNGGKHFIFAGSSAEYKQNKVLCKEEDILNPSTLYGQTKKSFSDIAAKTCEVNNLNFTELRFFPVFGENDTREKAAIVQAIRTFLKNEKFICKAPENLWSFIYKEDAAVAAKKVITSGYNGAVNIANPKPVLMREVFSKIAEIMNCESLLEFSDNKESLKLVADTAILNKEIGYVPQTSFDDGLRKTVEWWQRRYKEV